MNICLIRSPSPFLIDDMVFPPLGLMAVGTVKKESGWDVHIHCGSMETIPMNYDVYGLGPTTPEYSSALKILQYLKMNNKYVILGGPHASMECFSDGFDEVFFGAVPYDNLIIDRSLVGIKDYKYFIDGILATTLVTASGCPYKCAFCSKVAEFKSRNIDLVIKEIETLHYDFGYDALMFFDDTFILNPERVIKVCECLKRLGIIWRCFVRADLVIKHGIELLKVMADSGCVEVGMGIESGSDAILENINKGETIGEISTAIKMVQDKGIRVKGFIIIGLPGENQQTLQETNTFLGKVPLDDVDFTIFRPYPGSPIWKNKEKYDIQWDKIDPSKMFYKGRPGEYHNIVSTSGLSAADIVKAREDMGARWN